jgi:hypothetical protein
MGEAPYGGGNWNESAPCDNSTQELHTTLKYVQSDQHSDGQPCRVSMLEKKLDSTDIVREGDLSTVDKSDSSTLFVAN